MSEEGLASVEIGKIPVFFPIEPARLPLVKLEKEEKEVLRKCLDNIATAYGKVAPEIANTFKAQYDVIEFLASVFKGKIGIEAKKLVGFTPQPGMIGVNALIPQDIRYVKTPDATNPAYSQYELNSWDIALTAGTERWLLGDGTNYYRSKPEVNKRAVLVILKDGIVEVGTTPSFNQFIVRAETKPYTPFTVHQLIDLPIEKNLTLYQYNTAGAIVCLYDYGMMLGGMPLVTKTSNMRLIGVCIYETDYAKELRYVT